MTQQVTVHEDALQSIWQSLVDQASIITVLDAAVMTNNTMPDPEHFSVVLRQVQRQLLEAADRLDRCKDGAGEGES